MELKETFYNMYKEISLLEKKMETFSVTKQSVEKINAVIQLSLDYMALGEHLSALNYLKAYTEESSFTNDEEIQKLQIRAFLLLISALLNQNNLEEAKRYSIRLKLLLEQSRIENELKTMVLDYLKIQALLISRQTTDKKQLFEDIEKLELFYKNNALTFPHEMYINILVFYAEFYLEINENQKVMEALLKAVDEAENIHADFRKCILYRRISTYLESTHDYKAAFDYFEKYRTVRELVWKAKEYAYSEFLISKYNINLQTETLENLSEENVLLGTKVYMDALTGVYNRRYLNEVLCKKIDEQDESQVWSAILFDLDFFKKYNDSCGHLKGDQILLQVGTIIASYESNSIFAIRYGGEEFLVLLRNQSETDAEILASLIMKNLQEHKIFHPDSDISNYLTMSAGIASMECNSLSEIYELCKYADKALYYSKKNGRNKTTKYRSEICGV